MSGPGALTGEPELPSDMTRPPAPGIAGLLALFMGAGRKTAGPPGKLIRWALESFAMHCSTARAMEAVWNTAARGDRGGVNISSSQPGPYNMSRISARLRELLGSSSDSPTSGVEVAVAAIEAASRGPSASPRTRARSRVGQRIREGFQADWVVPVSSSNIDEVAYDSYEQTLRVKFLNGSVYDYLGVPVEVAVNLAGSPSTGRHLHRFVKDRFLTQRVL